MNKKARDPFIRLHFPSTPVDPLQSPRCRRTYGDHPFSVLFCLTYLCGRIGSKYVSLTLHAMSLYDFLSHRAEGRGPYVQRYECPAHTFGGQLFQKFRREVKPRGRRGDSARVNCIDGLIALPIEIRHIPGPLNIRGKRRLAQFLEQLSRLAGIMKPHPVAPLAEVSDHLRIHRVGKDEPAADVRFLRRVQQRDPVMAFMRVAFKTRRSPGSRNSPRAEKRLCTSSPVCLRTIMRRAADRSSVGRAAIKACGSSYMNSFSFILQIIESGTGRVRTKMKGPILLNLCHLGLGFFEKR